MEVFQTKCPWAKNKTFCKWDVYFRLRKLRVSDRFIPVRVFKQLNKVFVFLKGVTVVQRFDSHRSAGPRLRIRSELGQQQVFSGSVSSTHGLLLTVLWLPWRRSLLMSSRRLSPTPTEPNRRCHLDTRGTNTLCSAWAQTLDVQTRFCRQKTTWEESGATWSQIRSHFFSFSYWERIFTLSGGRFMVLWGDKTKRHEEPEGRVWHKTNSLFLFLTLSSEQRHVCKI